MTLSTCLSAQRVLWASLLAYRYALREAPVSRDMAFVALDSFDHVKALLRHMDQQLGGGLSAFETLWSDYYQLVTTKPAHSRPPVPHGHDFYVLLEAQGADGELDQQRFKMALESAFEQGLLVDAAVSQSESDCHAFWQIRDDVQQIFQLGTPLFFDVSLPIDRMSAYVDDVRSSLATTEALAVYVFGHLGDGNLHFGIPLPERSGRCPSPANRGLRIWSAGGIQRVCFRRAWDWIGKKARG